jgi:hypothetical protein
MRLLALRRKSRNARITVNLATVPKRASCVVRHRKIIGVVEMANSVAKILIVFE